MAAKEFIVTVSALDWEADQVLTLDNVRQILIDSVGYAPDAVIIDSITEFNRADYERTGKLGAIKKVRNLIGASLMESKMIVDAASNRADGKVTAFGVVVNYDPAFTPNAYYVRKA